MERSRLRKSKSASGIEGIQQVQKHKQKTVSRLSSDSRSYFDGSIREDRFVLNLGWSSLQRATGTPMKKLLAEEMSKEVVAKRRSPSVIGRLMGLEVVPSPLYLNRQQKRSSSSYQQKNVSVGFQHKYLYNGLTNRRSSGESQEFKDVYEDMEASNILSPRCSSRWSASSMLTKREIALIQDKFIDANCLSTDDKDYNKNLFPKFPQQDSFFVKRLHNHSSSSRDSHVAVLKPLSSAKYEGRYKALSAKIDALSRHDLIYNMKRKDCLLLDLNKAYISPRKSSNFQVEDNNEDNILPKKIVVLKPRKMLNSGISDSSPDHYALSDYRWKNSSHNFRSPRPVSKEAWEIARKIARRVRNGYDKTVEEKSTCFRGYAGDESSYEVNESDSDSESEEFRLPSRKPFGDCRLFRHPSCHLAESPVIKEAKHRLSERWKMTQKYTDLEIVRKGSTLDEMLALPDRETVAKKLDVKMSPGWAGSRFDGPNGIGYDPLGISTRDGWKVKTSGSSSRSISLASSEAGRSVKKNIHHDELAEYKHHICSAKKNIRHDELAENKHHICSDPIRLGRSSRSKKSLPKFEAQFEIQTEAKINGLSEQQPMLLIASKEMTDEHGCKMLSLESSEALQEDPSLVASDDDKSVAHDPEVSSFQELNKGIPEQDSPLQCLGGKPNFSENSKVANRVSPDSILEASFREDASSSSENFERVGADLNELRVQLQLLKMESGTYTEVSSVVPADRKTAQISQIISEEKNNLSGTECWEISYTLDVLIDSGLEESGFNMFITNWYAQDCPIDPKLFDDLENQHSDETSGSLSERRLLFDRINLALLEIFNENVDLFPWVTRKFAAGLSSIEEKDDIEVVLEKLISQEDINAELTERRMDKQFQWTDCRGEIDDVGNEIEKLLIDDLIIEVLIS